MLCCPQRKVPKSKQNADLYFSLLAEAQLLGGSHLKFQHSAGFSDFLFGIDGKFPAEVLPIGQASWFGFDVQLSKDASKEKLLKENPDLDNDDDNRKKLFEPELPEMQDDHGVKINFRWVRPQDVYKNPEMFRKDNGEDVACHFSDVNQGAFYNCWLMAALTIVARYGELAFKADNKVKLIEDLFSDISANEVTIKLNKKSTDPKEFGRWGHSTFKQTVSTKMVFSGEGAGAPAFVKSDSPGELWPPMMEKVIAASLMKKGETGYAAMSNGYAAMGVGMFIPGWPLRFLFGKNSEIKPYDLFPSWNQLLQNGMAITAAWKKPTMGLITEHQYAVLALVEYGKHQLVMFRNPWGRGTCDFEKDSDSGEWTGKYSDCDPIWKEKANAGLRAACKFTEREDGIFWMGIAEVCENLRDYDVFIPDFEKVPILKKCDLSKVPDLGDGPPKK